MQDPIGSDKAVPRRRERVTRRGAGGLLLIGAAGLLAVHWTFPSLPFDVATLVLVVLASVPLLSIFIDRLRFGELEIVARRADRALEEATTARKEQEADREAALEQDRNQDLKIGKALAAIGGRAPHEGTAGRLSEEHIVALARQYDELRAQRRPSSSRTSLMDEIVATMLGYAQQLDDYDVDAALSSNSPGMRLTGYAWLFAKPDAQDINAVLTALEQREGDVAFNQYWGIRALRAITASLDEPLSSDQVRRMRRILRSLPATGDRRREMDDLMRRIGDQADTSA